MNFEVGVVVTLKSGGPLMTVSHIDQFVDGISVHCVWFNRDLGIEHQEFHSKILKTLDGPNTSKSNSTATT